MVLFSPSPSLAVSFPASLAFPFIILSSGWFCSVLCPSSRLSFFLFLSFSLSFFFLSLSFLARGVVGHCSVIVVSSSFILSSFLCLFFFRPSPWVVVMFCSVPPFPYFLLSLFFPLVVLSSFLPSFCGGYGWLRFWCVLFPSFLIALSSLLSRKCVRP